MEVFIALGVYTPLYSFSLFLPTIIKNLGYTDPKVRQVSAPPNLPALAKSPPRLPS